MNSDYFEQIHRPDHKKWITPYFRIYHPGDSSPGADPGLDAMTD